CSFTFSSISVHHLSHTVDAVDDIQAGAIVPVHHEAAGIVDSRNGSLGADRRSLHIVHLEKLHAGACRVAGAERFKLLFCDHSHAATSFSGAPFFQLELPERFLRRIVRSALYSFPMKPSRRRKQRNAYFSLSTSFSVALMRFKSRLI